MNPVVLIVEDDATVRKGLMALMGMEGYAVHSAGTLAEAHEQLKTRAPTHIILDLNLPDGLGIELLRTIQAQGTRLRVLLLTGSADTHLLAEARRLGADPVVTKPPDWDHLVKWPVAI